MSISQSGTGDISAARVYARLLANDSQAALSTAPAATRTPGQQAIASTNLAQIQAAVGIRRTFSPFAY